MLPLSNKHAFIEQRLEALKSERQALDAQYQAGSLSKQDYEREVAKHDFLVAELTERNAKDQDQTQTYGRDTDLFES
ncbi:MAG: hypothetical protein KC587_11715 [Nitrospira sp.]|nr:hypothetical protein [Nitrospira sp.]